MATKHDLTGAIVTMDTGGLTLGGQKVIVSAANVRNGLIAGRYRAIPDSGATVSASMTNDRAYAAPFVLEVDTALADFCIECSAVATAGNIRAGIYGASSGAPGSLIADYGTQTIPTGGAAMMTWTPSADVLVAGTLYFATAVAQGQTGSATFRQRNTNSQMIDFGASRPSTLSGSFTAYYSDTGFTGALPGTFGAIAGRAISPLILVKA